MKLGIVITQNDAETAFNALRLGNYAIGQKDEVKVFLVGKAVEIEEIDDERFDVVGQANDLLEAGGKLLACGTCLTLRNSKGSEICPISTMADLYEIVRDSDRLVTF